MIYRYRCGQDLGPLGHIASGFHELPRDTKGFY
jgi:hypothetical protein